MALAVSGALVVIAFAAGTLMATGGSHGRGSGPPAVTAPVDLRGIERSLDELRQAIAASDTGLAAVRPTGGRDVASGKLAAVLERLDGIEALLADSAASPRTGTGPRPDWRSIETDLRSLRRPTDIAEIRRFIDVHRADFDLSRVPFVLSLMGVREVIDRFGWPEAIETAGTERYELRYRIHPETEEDDGTLLVYCSRFATTSAVIQFRD